MGIELRMEEGASDPVMGIGDISEGDDATFGAGEVIEVPRMFRQEDEIDASLLHQGIELLTALLVVEHLYLSSWCWF